MSLKDYQFKIYYNSDEDNISKDFYCEALKSAVLYKRSAGFFSSSSLQLISKGLEMLLKNTGKMQLIISPNLSKEDIEAIQSGYDNREKIINDNLINSFNNIDESTYNQYNFLAWLIYENRLDIKVVIRKDFSNYGIFHDKSGVIIDNDNNRIAFHGSNNESETAYLDNYESVNVFFSWESRDNIRVSKIEENFDLVWNDKCSLWKTYDFPKAIRERILKIRSTINPVIYPLGNDGQDFIKEKEVCIPSIIKLREYQKEAITSWLKNNGKGIFEMATGTGKTITSIIAMIKILQQYAKRNIPCGIVIVVPYKVLLEQWVDNLSIFNINPIKCYDSKDSWLNILENQIIIFNNKVIKNLFIITTNTTFCTNEFQKKLCEVKEDYIICIDEMHHMATHNSLKNLPLTAKYKLGLSATLMTKYENDNMNELISYFENGIIYNFPMQRAISEGFLTKYYYYPIFVELTDEEKCEYLKLSNQIGKRFAMLRDSEDYNLKSLLIKRARIIASAENKINILKNLKDKIINTKYNIFYCGDKIESNVRFIEKVNRTLSYDIGIKTHTFTSEENRIQRQEILKDFSSGNLHALTAIRCLDEGVDIPQLRRAFILSSGTNPKEFIQRRGRILRLSKGKEYAEIYDFITVPSLDKNYISELNSDELRCEQKILLREFERFKEFANLAINKFDAYNKILDVWSLYEK